MRAPNLAGALVSAATALPQATLATVRDPAEQSTAIAALVPDLAGHRYLSLTTFRKDGTPVATPVWFAAQGDRLVVASKAGAWKVRRLARTPRALGAGCDVRGEVHGPQIELKSKARDNALNDPTPIAVDYEACHRAQLSQNPRPPDGSTNGDQPTHHCRNSSVATHQRRAPLQTPSSARS